MKKVIVLGLVVLTLFLQFCKGPNKALSAKKAEPVISYTANIAPVMAVSCTPCHFPPKGNKAPFDTYASVKNGIDEIVGRIQKNPGEKGFMPARHEKLTDSTIQMFVKWKETGLAE